MPCPVNQTPWLKVDSRWRRWLDGLGRVLIPPQCLVCGEAGAAGRDLCAACFSALPWNHQACRQCALPLAQAADFCGHCLKLPPVFTRTTAPLIYRDPLCALLPKFKFHGDLAAGRVVSEVCIPMFLDALAAEAPAARPQALIPVPLHAARLRQRGYDQALELAKTLALSTGLPLLSNALHRQRATSAQTQLSAVARRKNIRGAFTVTQPDLPEYVALIDDVMTTGATVNECARTLLGAGVKRVDVWVLARVPSG